MAELAGYTVWAPTLMLVIFRVAGLFLAAPLLSSASIPMPVKAMLSVVLGLAVTARLAAPAAMPQTWAQLVLGVGSEMLVGGAMGFAASLFFTGIELAAEHISQQMGIGLANVYNPLAEDSTNVLAGLFQMTALAVFLAIGGHRVLMGGLLDSFGRVPLMGLAAHDGMLESVLSLLAAAFVLGFKLSAPAVLALFLATLALGFVQRTMPQLNILSVGFQVRVMLGLLVMVVSLAAMVPLIEAAWRLTLEQMTKLF